MRGSLLRAVTTIATLAAVATVSGCSTCASVEATYDEAWEATRLALVRVPHMSTAGPRGRYDAGTFVAEVTPPGELGRLHYRTEIEPVGGRDREKRRICVRVLEVEDVVSEPTAGDRVTQVQTTRRQDLEAIIARRIEQTFAARGPGD